MPFSSSTTIHRISLIAILSQTKHTQPTGGILTGVLTALFGYLYLVITRPTYNAGGSMTAVLVLLCFLLGISMFGVIGTVIQSGVATTFVCLAEDPEALRRFVTPGRELLKACETLSAKEYMSFINY
ncbi:hypothetical protein BC937DRAFT_94341 [Endogone sp. FLAS-F59071]|nr:hypothetical protein BC937DRAFT_94341 [Endogone sp. FLAS-F59071]|eukprot:RUS14100.1 hypothetical protein BC937DRAFT_94341 [Endogone sp. FLAS-F59071]